MKTFFTAIALTLLMSIAFAEQHDHKKSPVNEKTGHSKSSLVLNHGEKWPVDQVMRENMSAIHQKFKLISELSKSNKISNKEARDLSTVISESAKNIVSKCKMEAKQDAAFHAILSDLFAVAAELQKGDKVESPLEKLRLTLKSYTEYFDQSFSN
ncbi:MAG: hypothetical protein COT73_06365 [Bdellovibrio sp. CG10_big_fil_rev_8_21_14_0_10_47_8]|nr:MAG: hypothetical protein COT73_06365 [Bdellovibrio sp. CG10_big_fil_rev_8_21_14_0_10_47_8]